MTRAGLLVTVDGPGGVGKSTAIAVLLDQLAAAGLPVYGTTEPSRAPAGELARNQTHIYHGRALAHLVAADRYHHLETEILPALARGEIVVCDRYLPSSLVFQRLDGLDIDTILRINEGVTPPDLAIILTAHPDVIQARLRARGSHSRFEDDPATTWHEVRLYHETADLLRNNGITVEVVDSSSLTPAQIADAMFHPIVALWRHRVDQAAR
ncbi:dTMP kinase [Carbonactinospora thermoautotrophica]|uniref:dTMP kinase n=1 Tax=Carbonactinospora thermoautotrophica TaxID=1469144 RepID=UPI0022716015|nr:dTMP kinase [Carbonactinospora thermoautotrophica]MCX9192964.1 dTMP kinase [Carbonactinospora thermoautotrophica]